ncbi:M28 family peptidase [Edaphobacter albus]|uniref:M28 family peptidase n=1 Tax=Edaphobacter sp. 4G125 TaxID=2763071 RepID=UPI0016449390|nr:M28 family peptidase [Edaphobacter sp. 4G125]QNI37908.1 M28 family peptidase [Edaphobacter sp. 4G125]
MFSRPFLCLLLLTVPLSAQTSKTINAAADLIQPNDLKADIYFLASDNLAGRNSGSLEDHIATDYIASEFLRLGLKPMGDNGTFFQNMEILTGRPDAERTTLTTTIEGKEHRYSLGHDFQLARQSLRNTEACGQLAFAGYGISAPEFHYDDLAGIDLKGKIAMVFTREPQANDPNSRLMGTWDSYHAFNWHKVEELRKRGAAGILIVQDRIPRDVKPIPPTSPRPTGEPSYALAGEMWDIPVFIIKREIADQLLAPNGKTADSLQAAIDRSLQPSSFDLPKSSACVSKTYTGIEAHKGRNVVALLEGSDPKLKAQTIILTAHHDHMGTSNGHIYHGADDNASGVSGMLSVARAFTKGKVQPKRSILFLAYDAEERIFLGSYYYVTHPVVPLNQTVATLNLDMIGRNEDDANWPTPADRNVNMVNVLGTRYNPALRRIIDHENQQAGLKLDYKMDTVDPDSLWSRSDHFWFATLHIPQVEFQTGLHPDYHTENDTWDRINYPKLTKIARLVYLSVADLASSDKTIQFLPAGSEPAK